MVEVAGIWGWWYDELLLASVPLRFLGEGVLCLGRFSYESGREKLLCLL